MWGNSFNLKAGVTRGQDKARLPRSYFKTANRPVVTSPEVSIR
jgi:hypothetical protein